ncbi:aldo/keto reductase [Streptacidiphilus sp. N1-12]|uniref:Aldo/keto reductase n=2 Tax=Streptacidiphilus alkalitolerans TaxID=3342712 RepID=A0ABV6WDM8_9ACTN
MRAAYPRVVLGLHRSRYQRSLLTDALELGIDAIDTSFNYRDFTAHNTLAQVAGDVLPHLTLSTKVGYFPGPSASEHSLDPARLRAALEQTNRDLGRPPDLVFLHNPEASLPDATEASADALKRAFALLADATAQGLCRAWGVASWNPRPLTDLALQRAPQPSVLMVRAGLLVGSDTLTAAEALAARWDLPQEALWGMSPFGGGIHDPVWKAVDPRLFLQDPTGGLTRVQAAFRTAYRLPQVSTLAVGSDNPAHLRQLLNALRHEVDDLVVEQYRELLRGRALRQRA